MLLHLVSRTLGAGDTFAYLPSRDVTSKCSWEKTSQRSVTSPNTATSAVTCPSSVVFPVTRREGTQDEEDEDGAQDGEATPAASGHVTGWPRRAGWRMAAFRADWMLWPTRTWRQLPPPVLRSPSGPPSLPPLCFPVLRVLFGAHGPPLTKPGRSHGNERRAGGEAMRHGARSPLAWAGCGLQHRGQDRWVVASVGRALSVLICSLGRWACRRVISQNHVC